MTSGAEEDELLPRSYGSRSRSRSPTSSSSRRRQQSQGTASSRSLCVNRIFILLLLVGMVVAGVFYQGKITALEDELQSEEQKSNKLQKTIKDHAAIIARFNESVTNADVLSRLKHLSSDLEDTRTSLEHKMDYLNSKIQEQLQSTLEELGSTVTKAQQEIEEQVERVKSDVDHYVITTQDQFSMENSFMVYQLAGTLTLLSCLISMWHMTAHMRKMREEVVQRKILAILWMSPIYAVTSWFSLVFHNAEGYLAIIKDAYEAYVIYQFLSFCIAVLGKGDRNKVVDLLTQHADHLTPPFRMCGLCDKRDPYEGNPHALADAILLQCQVFAMQFVFFRPLTTIATVFLNKMEFYGEADNAQDYRAPQFYIAIIQNISIFVAFTGLLKFYHAVDKDLAWCRPFAKFLCIKGVVFMTFWQGLAITILAETTDAGGGQPEEWAQSAQNFMICLEMLLFSIAHFYCFPTDEWEPGYRAKASRGLSETLAVGDFLQDLKLILRAKTPKRKKKSKAPTEPTLEEGEEDDDDDDATEQTSTTSAQDTLERLETAIKEGLSAEDDEAVREAKERLQSLAALGATASDDLSTPQTSHDHEEDRQRNGEGNEETPAPDKDRRLSETISLLAFAGRHSDLPPEEEDVVVPRTKNDEVLKPSIFTKFGKGSDGK